MTRDLIEQLLDELYNININDEDSRFDLSGISLEYSRNKLKNKNQKLDNFMRLYKHDFSKKANLLASEELLNRLHQEFKKLFNAYQTKEFEGDYKELPEYEEYKKAKDAISEDYKKDPKKYMPWDPMSG